MMKCGNIQKLLSVYIDGELQPTENKEVKNHLSQCVLCQKELKILEKSWTMLSDLETISPRPDYISRFWSELAIRKPWHEKVLEGIREAVFQKQLAPVWVAACMVIVVGALALRNYFQIQHTEQMLASLSSEDIELVEFMELAENYEILENFDLIEDLEIIEHLDELEQLGA